MKEYAQIYHIYYNPIFFALRVIAAIFLLVISIFLFREGLRFYPFISGASVILIFEIFFHFKIAKANPTKSIAEIKDDMSESMFLDTAVLIYSSHHISGMIKDALKIADVKFLLNKTNIKKEEVPAIEIEFSLIEKKAIELARSVNNKFIKPSDLIAAYLILIEPQTKLLLKYNIKEKDLLNILKWRTLVFQENAKEKLLGGQGIADDWVFGWMSETQKYMIDLTSEVLKKKRYFYPIGEEYTSFLSYLASFKSVFLIGNSGSGKDSLVEQFIVDSYEGRLDKKLNHIRVFQFLIDQFLAGANEKGEIEQRLKNIIEELSHSKDLVIFIENVEVILGSKDFNFDISNVLTPYLKDSHIRIIGTSTPQMYKQFIEDKTAFLDFISVMNVSDPGLEEDMFILFEKSFEIEAKFNVYITYKAVETCLELAPKYLPSVSMPGSGVRLLEDTAASQIFIKNSVIDALDVEKKVQEKTKIPVSSPSLKERKDLLNLEPEIHKYIVDQNEAVSQISEAIRRTRSGISNGNKPSSFLFLGPTGVGKTQTAKVVSNIYFGGEKEIIRLDMSEYSSDQATEKLLSPDSNSFLDQVFSHPYSLILLDEFEKANPKVLNLFLQLFDDARLTDRSGKTVSFQNCLIVATSNAGSEFVRENISGQNSLPENFNKILIDYLLKQNIFTPELINRFDGLVVFKPLSSEDILAVTKLIIADLQKSLEEKEIFVRFDPSVIEKVAKEGFDPQFGARPLRRFVQDFIEDPMSKAILKGDIQKGSKFEVTVNTSGQLLFKQ